MHKIFKELLDYVFPINDKEAWRLNRIPSWPLIWKSLIINMAAIMLSMILALPIIIGKFSEAWLLFLIPIGFCIEVACGALAVKWIYHGLKTQWVFELKGKKSEFIPFKDALKISWSCGWRAWFLKFICMGGAALTLIAIGKLTSWDTSQIIVSSSFSKTLLRYDYLTTLLGLVLFLPVLEKIDENYRFKKLN